MCKISIMKISFDFLNFIHRSRNMQKFYRQLNILYIISSLSLFLNFYTDIDSYNQGLTINSFQGELYILGVNMLVLQLVMIIYNIDKKIIDKKLNYLKNIPLNLFNIIGISLSIYVTLLYFFITQSNAFGVNPLFKSYGLGFYLFSILQLIALLKVLKSKNS